MIDNLPAVLPTTTDELFAEPSPGLSEWRKREELEARAIPLNKANIIAALKRAAISKVIVEFDGSGDSGGIEHTSCIGNDGKIPPGLAVSEWSPDENFTLVANETKLPDAIENFAYALLSHTEAGWENDAGAYGEITIDVEAGTALHTHNTRFEDVHTSTHAY
jgi:hypothetical protein